MYILILFRKLLTYISTTISRAIVDKYYFIKVMRQVLMFERFHAFQKERLYIKYRYYYRQKNLFLHISISIFSSYG